MPKNLFFITFHPIRPTPHRAKNVHSTPKNNVMPSFKTALPVFLIITALFALSFTPPGKKKRKFIDPANMDLTTRPGDNFYQYVNGNWIRNNPVPPSKTRWGSFDELREANLVRLRSLLEEAAAAASKDSKSQK